MSTVIASVNSLQRDTRVAGFRIMHISHSSDARVAQLRRLVMFDEYFTQVRRIEIGRTSQRHIRFRDEMTLSRLHATVERTGESDFVIHDQGSKNGVMVADAGHYSEYRSIRWLVLRLGIFIRLGNIKLIPVNRLGRAPILASQHHEFLSLSLEMYGNQAHKHTGVPRAIFRRLRDEHHKARRR